MFQRKDTTSNFMGITWEITKTPKSLGVINENSLANLSAITDCTINNIEDIFVVNSIEYFNGAGTGHRTKRILGDEACGGVSGLVFC